MKSKLDLAAGEQVPALPGVRQARLVSLHWRAQQPHGCNLCAERIAQTLWGRRLASRATR